MVKGLVEQVGDNLLETWISCLAHVNVQHNNSLEESDVVVEGALLVGALVLLLRVEGKIENRGKLLKVSHENDGNSSIGNSRLAKNLS